jgi:hypothetical protein
MTRKKRIKAYRKHFSFALADQDKYLLFLKNHFQKTEPRFYSVVAKKQVQGMDCKVWMLTLDKDIENPNHEVIAECTINSEKIYLWRDHCWGIAVNKEGKPLYYAEQLAMTPQFPAGSSSQQKHMMRFDNCIGRHTIIVFRIGNQIVE